MGEKIITKEKFVLDVQKFVAFAKYEGLELEVKELNNYQFSKLINDIADVMGEYLMLASKAPEGSAKLQERLQSAYDYIDLFSIKDKYDIHTHKGFVTPMTLLMDVLLQGAVGDENTPAMPVNMEVISIGLQSIAENTLEALIEQGCEDPSVASKVKEQHSIVEKYIRELMEGY